MCPPVIGWCWASARVGLSARTRAARAIKLYFEVFMIPSGLTYTTHEGVGWIHDFVDWLPGLSFLGRGLSQSSERTLEPFLGRMVLDSRHLSETWTGFAICLAAARVKDRKRRWTSTRPLRSSLSTALCMAVRSSSRSSLKTLSM